MSQFNDKTYRKLCAKSTGLREPVRRVATSTYWDAVLEIQGC